MKFFNRAIFLAFVATTSPAWSQNAKEIKTTKGRAVGLTNLLALRPDCNQGLVEIPVVTVKPTHGDLQEGITVLDIPATGNCPARKLPVIVLVYAPENDFVGKDMLTFELHSEGRLQSFSYTITVLEN